jgi:hypothetical protein
MRQMRLACERMVEEVSDHDLKNLVLYWNEKRGERAYPKREDIEIADLRPLIGDIIILDVERDPLAFRYRLFGTHLATRRGYDMTGRTVAEIPEPELRDFLSDKYRRAVESGEPHHAVRDTILDRRYHAYEIVVLPLSGDGETVDKILGAIRYIR